MPAPGDLMQDGDALIIVPPFFTELVPCLAAHLLQACAREAGFEVRVLYANLLFAAVIGGELYGNIAERMANWELLGERLFSAAAFGTPPLRRLLSRPRSAVPGGWAEPLDEQAMTRVEDCTGSWADTVATAVASRSYSVVGCTTSFEQTAACLAILNRIKRLRPALVTVLGGANCEGDMAEGIAVLPGSVDFIFSGESEESWPGFLKSVRSGCLPLSRIIRGRPCADLGALPLPDFREYHQQLKAFLPSSSERDDIWLPYESSRGCWWGEKSHCTFCGLNGEQMRFREKPADRVLADLRNLVAENGPRKICMVDNIMPHSYFRTLIPRMAEELPGLYLHYEQKANLSLSKVLALKRAGVMEIQPGIEALSSSFLARMKKGVNAAQNIALLRYARAAGLKLKWNLLVDFPGDDPDEYRSTLALLPLLRHLPPPGGMGRLRIDRFSPYFMRAAEYGIQNLKPNAGYFDAFPPEADLMRIAYHFEGEYESAGRAHPEWIEQIREEVDAWRAACSVKAKDRPVLWVHQLDGDLFILRDTRRLPGIEEAGFLNRQQALLALTGWCARLSAEAAFAIDRKLCVLLDGHYVPLATAKPELLLELETEVQRCRHLAGRSTQEEPLLVQAGDRS